MDAPFFAFCRLVKQKSRQWVAARVDFKHFDYSPTVALAAPGVTSNRKHRHGDIAAKAIRAATQNSPTTGRRRVPNKAAARPFNTTKDPMRVDGGRNG
jgi:hypothetical protein